MDRTLALDLPVDEGPFTRRTSGLTDRAAWDRAVRSGAVRRLLRGVYADAAAPDTPALRRRALALVVPAGAVVVGPTAAWAHGVDLPGHADDTRPIVDRRGSHRLPAADVERRDGLWLTTPLRTGLDTGRALPAADALAVLDGLLRTGGLVHRELLEAVDALHGLAGVRQLRALAPLADARAVGPVESALRWAWCRSDLPTPVPGLEVAGVRLALGLPAHGFGVVLAGAGARDVHTLAGHGWCVSTLARARVLRQPDLLGRHLVSEFRAHLLRQLE